jgi:hypothetical protein
MNMPTPENFRYENTGYSVREGLPEAYRWVWDKIAQPGNWWTGTDRVGIAAESRNAIDCQLCAKRKDALSPFGVDGEHHTTTNLPRDAVDTVHRITTDPSRLTRTWLNSIEEQGLTDTRYVELLGVVVAIISIDVFHRALGLPLEPLPDPQEGQPSGYRPPGAKNSGAWVDTITPQDLSEPEADLYGASSRTGNVMSAMSLVPDSVRMLTALGDVQYLPAADVVSMSSNHGRALRRPQIELIAGRVSSLSDCFY